MYFVVKLSNGVIVPQFFVDVGVKFFCAALLILPSLAISGIVLQSAEWATWFLPR